MKRHPATTMLLTWLACAAAWIILPYQRISQPLALEGALLLTLFISAFIAGTLLSSPGGRRSAWAARPVVDSELAAKVLAVASLLASTCFLLDARDKSLFDLALAYEVRTEAADALLKGEISSSSVWFQAAFLLYPAGYVYTALHLTFSGKTSVVRVVMFGALPILLATLAQGGRVPIFYLMLVAWLALRERPHLHPPAPLRSVSTRRAWLIRLFWGAAAVLLFGYFAAVFMIRAEVVGGAAGMFEIAEDRWGVSFRGALSPLIFALLGEDVSYLLFVFVWYLVQGLVMSNIIFSSYDGPLQLGVYGIDLASAVARRIDPEGVAKGFDALLALGTYGFLPSAWGSLYVDLGLIGLLPAFIWGLFAGYCYRRVVVERSSTWLLVAPFVTLGIFFSLINTPLGFTNGLVTHAWLFVAFALLRPRGRPSVASAAEVPA